MPECDYYTNPTILSQCIKMDDFAAASRRLANHPDEARVWVVRRISTPPVEKSSPPSPAVAKVAVYQPTAERQIVTTSRALPIHMVLARESLAAFCDHQQRARNQLLAGLITSYPDACALRAPNTRQYIVESLIEQHATTQLVSLALAACPAALDRIAPAVLQADSDLPERLRRLVGRGRAFWEQVRAYAQLDQTNDQHHDHDGDDNNDDDDDEDKNNKGDGGGVETNQANKSIMSLAWSNGIQDYKALEQRCLTLERMVLAANVENFELQQELAKRDEMITKLKVDMEEQVRDILDNLQSSPQPVQPPSSAAVAPTTTKWLESIQERQSAAPAASPLAPLATAPPSADRPAFDRPVPLPIAPEHQLPPSLRRHDCTSTIVSSLSLDRSRYPSQSSKFGSNNNNDDDDDNDDDNDDDDEDTKALLDAIGRPMSPLEPLQVMQRIVLDEQQQQQQQQQRPRPASVGPEPSDKNNKKLTASTKRRKSIQEASKAASRPPLPRPPPPPALRRQDCSSNTIVSSLSLDQSRYPSGRFTREDVDDVDNDNNADDGDDDDDEDTYALLDAIGRPMSPLEPLVQMANKEVRSQQHGTLPFVPVLDETSVDDDDATLDTILREAELWTGRKLSPSVVRAWMQIPSPFETEMEATTTDRVVVSRGNSTHRTVA